MNIKLNIILILLLTSFFTFLTIVSNTLLGDYIGLSNSFIYFINILLIVLFLNPLHNIFNKIINNFKKEEEQKDIKTAQELNKDNLCQRLDSLNKELKVKLKEKTQEIKDINSTLEERNNFLITIQSIINVTSKTFNLREATQMIADSISTKLNYIGGILSFVNEENNTLKVRALTKNNKTISIIKRLKKNNDNFEVKLELGYNLGSKTVLNSKITFSDNLNDYFSPPLAEEILKDIQKELNINTIIGIPIFSQGKSIGLIHFLCKEKREDVTPLDMEAMTTLADQVGIISRNLKLYENLQKTNRQLQEANVHLRHLDKSKSEFLSIASHQLRTPISALKGYLDMILEGDFGKVPLKIKKILKILLENSSRLARTINIFLDVSRIESGKFHLDKKVVKVDSLIIDVLKELENEAKVKGLKLEYQKSKNNIFSLIDADKIREVILNLIDNAIKYTKKGLIVIKLSEEDKELEFSVKDSGLGISAEDLPLLFKKFARGTGASNIYTSGSGLGLFIAQKVIKEHNGQIWAESKGKNRGSTFSFSLPIYENS